VLVEKNVNNIKLCWFFYIFVYYLKVTMGKLGPMEIILIIAVILLLFGGKKIPELMKGLGGGIKEFKKAAKGEDETPSNKKDANQE
jgi:sec-independent protein translocase protein TatA